MFGELVASARSLDDITLRLSVKSVVSDLLRVGRMRPVPLTDSTRFLWGPKLLSIVTGLFVAHENCGGVRLAGGIVATTKLLERIVLSYPDDIKSVDEILQIVLGFGLVIERHAPQSRRQGYIVPSRILATHTVMPPILADCGCVIGRRIRTVQRMVYPAGIRHFDYHSGWLRCYTQLKLFCQGLCQCYWLFFLCCERNNLMNV